ncbi:MAG: hypothetical protein AAFU50_01220 [Pseudomonadota bacterium]
MSGGEEIKRPPCPETLRAQLAAAELADALAAVRTRIAREAKDANAANIPLNGDVIQPLPFATASAPRDRTSTDVSVAPTESAEIRFEPVKLKPARRLFRAPRLGAWRVKVSSALNAVSAVALIAGLGVGGLLLSEPRDPVAASTAHQSVTAERAPIHSVASATRQAEPQREIVAAPVPSPDGVTPLRASPVLVRDIRSVAAEQFAAPDPTPQPVVPPKPTAVVRLGPPAPDPSTTVTAAVREYRYTSATIDGDVVAPKPKLAGRKRQVRLPKSAVRRAVKRVPPLRRVRPPKIGMPTWAERAFNRGD